MNPSFVVNCDVWTDYPFQQLKHILDNALGHLILVNNPVHNPQGDFHLVNHHVELINPSFSENYYLCGIAVYHPNLFKDWPKGGAQPHCNLETSNHKKSN